MHPCRLALVVSLLGAYATGCRCQPAGDRESPPVRAPEELADEQALAVMSDWRTLPVLGTGRYRQQSSDDRETGAPVPVALWRNGNRDMNNFVCASDDASPVATATEFVLDQARCPEPYLRGYVLGRFEGSGRLARIWLTAASIRRWPADREVLRIYVDDDRTPRVEAPLSKVLDGSAGEMFAKPFGAGSGRRMAWYYPVVFASKLIVALDQLDAKDLYFHQTSVVLDAVPRPRQAATARLAARDRALALLRSEGGWPAELRTTRATLTPGESVVAHALDGPATIGQARLRVARAALAELDDVVLRVRWDHASSAAIELPLSWLFASAQGITEQSSLALGARLDGDRIELVLRLPMPFAQRAEWALSNRGSRTVELELALDATPSLPSSRWGLLHAQAFDTTVPFGATHPLASARGAGRLAGVCMMMAGHALKMPGMKGHALNFLEGDERGVIDGVRAMAGTGTEDYFNGAFYFEDAPWASPFAQVWGLVPGEPDGKAQVSACRWHVLGDAVDFATSLDLDMEIGPGDATVLDRYRSVAFLYLEPSPGPSRRP
jgi:hypothetical protein